MKKRILSVIIFVTIILLVGGCKTKTKLLDFSDEKNNLKVTMSVPENSAFTITDQETDEDGKVNEFILENTDLNITTDIYFFKSYNGYFEDSKKDRKDKDNYKEFTFNSYNAYTYQQTSSSQDIIVLVNTEDDKETLFYMYINLIDYTKDTKINDVVNSEEFQNMMNTIEFSK